MAKNGLDKIDVLDSTPGLFTFFVKATITGYSEHVYQQVILDILCEDVVTKLVAAPTTYTDTTNFVEETG